MDTPSSSSSSRATRSSLRIAARSSPRLQDSNSERAALDTSTSSGTGLPQRRLRLRRQPSNVEYDPENPFDDVQRDAAGTSSAHGSAKASSSRAARLSGHSERSSREASPLDVDAGVKTRYRDRPTALEQETALQSQSRNTWITRDTEARKSPPSSRKSPSGSRNKESSRSQGKDASTDDVSQRSIAADAVSPEHQSLSKETMEALTNLEMMLEKLKLGSSGSPAQPRESAKPKSKSPPLTAEKRKERLAMPVESKQPSRRTLSPSLQRKSTPTQPSPSKADFLRRVEQMSPARETAKAKEVDDAARAIPASEHKNSKNRSTHRSKSTVESEQELRRSPRQHARRKETSMSPEAGTSDQHDVDRLARALSRARIAGQSLAAKSEAKRESSKSKASLTKIAEPARQMPARKDFLKGMSLLLDVRDQNGDDCSHEWQYKLEDAGAFVTFAPPKPVQRRSSRHRTGRNEISVDVANIDCIVYRNGKPSTLRWYKSQVQQDALTAPAIVSVHWITASLEQKQCADVRDFLVEVGKQSLNKPRTSASPREATGTDENADTSGHSPFSALVARRKSLTSAPDRPSPLARRCWNMDSSTSSIATNFTATSTMSGGGA